jgi:hypothetical protein
MKLWRLTTWVFAFALTPPILLAEDLQALQAFCHEQAASGGPPCHLQPCPCAPGDSTVKQSSPDSAGVEHCACRSAISLRQHTRRQAVAACDRQRQNTRHSCFVSRGECPRGFDTLESFSDANGNRFSSCRDSRHQQSLVGRKRPYSSSDLELLPEYNKLIARLESQQIGVPVSLPLQSVKRLANSFPGDAVNQLSLIRTAALERGFFSDCTRVFCADDGQVEGWTDSQRPLISRDLLHHIVHAVHCEREGGRNAFVKHWFQHLPDDVHARLQANLPLDAEKLHYAMYMERHANSRADALCRRLSGCETSAAP